MQLVTFETAVLEVERALQKEPVPSEDLAKEARRRIHTAWQEVLKLQESGSKDRLVLVERFTAAYVSPPTAEKLVEQMTS